MKVLTPFDDLPKKSRKKLLATVGIFLFLFILVVVLPAFRVYWSVQATKKSAQVLTQKYRERDFPGIKASIKPVSDDLKKTQGAIKWFRFVGPLPILGNYYHDAIHLTNAGLLGLETTEVLVAGLEPYAEDLGLKAKTQTPQQVENRVQVFVKALNALLPVFDEISPKVEAMRNELETVNPQHYPKSLFGFRAREQLGSVKILVGQVGILLVDAKPLIKVLPEILGDLKPKNYLVLFQNDKEIRPSGGFLTAFTYLKANQGKITTSGSDDIYSLDEQIDRVCLNVICNLAPPLPIIKYLPEPTGKTKQAIESRDSNLSPDFKLSAQEFTRFYTIVGRPAYDGIIAVDTFLVRDLLAVVGPIKVSGYETPFDKDNVVETLEGYSEMVFAGRSGRKAVLGDLMNSIFMSVLQAPSNQFIPIFQTFITSLNEKHILFYLKDNNLQKVLEDLGWAGRIVDPPAGGDWDYFHLNDSNFAGGKAGLFVTQEVSQEIKIAGDGTISKTVTIKYKNPGKYNPERNPGFRDWVRLFVPKGSKLISSSGSQNEVLTSEDLGKTVFEAFQTVRPEGSSTLKFEYQLPFKHQKGSEFKMLIQKQPGTDGDAYKIKLNGQEVVDPSPKTDRTLQLKI